MQLDNYVKLSKKSKSSDVTFIKKVPLHPWKRLDRLSKTDDNIYFLKEVARVRPTTTKKKINKMKLITDQIEASLDNTTLLLAGDFNFSLKKY